MLLPCQTTTLYRYFTCTYVLPPRWRRRRQDDAASPEAGWWQAASKSTTASCTYGGHVCEYTCNMVWVQHDSSKISGKYIPSTQNKSPEFITILYTRYTCTYLVYEYIPTCQSARHRLYSVLFIYHVALYSEVFIIGTCIIYFKVSVMSSIVKIHLNSSLPSLALK